MRKFVFIVLTCMLFITGCKSTEYKLAEAREVYDAESFCINAIDTIGGRSYGHTRYKTKDYVVYSIWRWDGLKRYYIDETGIGISEDPISLKVRYSGSKWIDYTFSWGDYAEEDTTGEVTMYTYYTDDYCYDYDDGYNSYYDDDYYDEYDYDDYDDYYYYEDDEYEYYDDDDYYYDYDYDYEYY